MTEQIIINGVDVSQCKSYFPNLGKLDDCIALGIGTRGRCEQNLNCYYKQLVRKTAECEKHTKYIFELLQTGENYKSKLKIATEALKTIVDSGQCEKLQLEAAQQALEQIGEEE